MAPLRVAVIGVGHLGKEHARILSGMAGVELAGVADVSHAQAEAVARRCGTRAFADHRQLLALVDAAVVVVPTTYHHAVAGDFLRRGIPVLVEKPLALNLTQAEELAALSRRHGAVLQVGHIERFNPAFEELQRRPLQPKYVCGERLGQFAGRSGDIGAVLDLMIHDIDLVLALARSPVRRVEALGMSVLGGPEDMATARLFFENGCVADLTASRLSSAPSRRMRVWAPEGQVTLDLARRTLTLVQPSEEVRQGRLAPGRLDAATAATLKDDLFGRHLQVLELDRNGGDQLTRELEEFVHCARTGDRPRVGAEEACAAMAVAGAILERVWSHGWEGRADGPAGPHQLPAPRGQLFRPVEGSAAA